MIFLLLSGLNILILILLRVLAKRNIFINSLAYLTIFFQIVTLIISVVRERNFSSVPFEITFFFIGSVFCLIFLIPIAIEKLFSIKKKLQLQTIENSIKVFLLEVFYEFLENNEIFAKFCNNFTTKLNFIAINLVVSRYLWVVLIIPWLIFFNFFLVEILTKNFLFSPYLLAYWLFFYRFIVLFFYIAKNRQASLFIDPLRTKIKSFLPIELYLDFKTLVDLVLSKESLEKSEKIENWRNFNEFMSPFTDFSILNDFFYHQLSYFKKTIDTLNFIVIISWIFFFGLESFFGFDESIFFFCFFFSSGYFLFFLNNFKENDLEKSYLSFFKDLIEFLCHFKFVLINEHNFSRKETDDNFTLPIRSIFAISFKNFFTVFLFSFWIILIIFYCLFKLDLFFSFLIYLQVEPLVFLDNFLRFF